MPCKILLIEDDLLLREEIKLLLENAGYQAAVPDVWQDAAPDRGP